MRKLILLANEVGPDEWAKYGELVALLSLLEWFLEEAILLIILGRAFDSNRKADRVLQKQISGSNFTWKIQTIEEFDLLSVDLKNRLAEIRRRRNIFIHGIGIRGSDKYNLQDRKGNKEVFSTENISGFINYIENTGGLLLDEFERGGFRLPDPGVLQQKTFPNASG